MRGSTIPARDVVEKAWLLALRRLLPFNEVAQTSGLWHTISMLCPSGPITKAA